MSDDKKTDLDQEAEEELRRVREGRPRQYTPSAETPWIESPGARRNREYWEAKERARQEERDKEKREYEERKKKREEEEARERRNGAIVAVIIWGLVIVAIVVIGWLFISALIGTTVHESHELRSARVADSIYWTEVSGGGGIIAFSYTSQVSESFAFKWIENDTLSSLVIEANRCTVKLTNDTFRIEFDRDNRGIIHANVYLPREAVLSALPEGVM